MPVSTSCAYLACNMIEIRHIFVNLMLLTNLLVPRSRVADRGTIESGSVRPSRRLSVRLSLCLSVCQQFSYTFYSALDLPHYWQESNETLDNGRIYIEVVHLGIGFIERRKMCR